jgi:hypothetical protein
MIRAMTRVFQAVVCVVVLSACGSSDGTLDVEAQGGGGSGSSRGSGSGSTGGGAFVVTSTTLTFTAVQNGELPAPQSLHIHRNETTATFGSSCANSGTALGWLEKTSSSKFDTTASDFDLDFTITTTTLTPGTYNTSYNAQLTKSFYCAPTGGPCIRVDVIGERTIPITYLVTAP